MWVLSLFWANVTYVFLGQVLFIISSDIWLYIYTCVSDWTYDYAFWFSCDYIFVYRQLIGHGHNDYGCNVFMYSCVILAEVTLFCDFYFRNYHSNIQPDYTQKKKLWTIWYRNLSNRSIACLFFKCEFLKFRMYLILKMYYMSCLHVYSAKNDIII